MERILAMFSDTGGRELGIGAAGAIAVNVGGIVAAFFLQLTLARLMGIENYGTYIYVISWMGIFVLLGSLGLESCSVRFTAAYAANDQWGLLRGFLDRSVQIIIIASCAATVGVVIFISIYPAPVTGTLMQTFCIGAFLLPVWALTNFKAATIRALKRIVLSRFPEAVLRPVLLTLFALNAYWLLKSQLSPELVMLFHVISACISFIVLNLSLLKTLPEEIKRTKPLFHSRLWVKTGISLMFISSIYIVLGTFDSLMLGVLRGVKEVGAYAAASRISVLVLFGLQAVNLIAAPMISEFFSSKSKAELQNLISRATIGIFLLAVPVYLLILLAGQFLLALFGREFTCAYPALILLSTAYLANASIGPGAFLLTMTGFEREGLKITGISLAANIVLNIPAIYLFGLEGAAAATGLSLILGTYLVYVRSGVLLGVNPSVIFALRKQRTAASKQK